MDKKYFSININSSKEYKMFSDCFFTSQINDERFMIMKHAIFPSPLHSQGTGWQQLYRNSKVSI